MKKSLNILTALMLGSAIFSACYEKFDPASYQPALSIGGFTNSAEIQPEHLIAYFPFDGDYKDQISGTEGTNTGTSFSNGFKGQAMQGAIDAYVLFNPTPTIVNMTSFTITHWVNSPLNENGIVGLVNLSNTKGFWGNIDMFFENGSTQDAAKFRAHIQNGATDSWVAKDGIPGVFGNWTAFALTYDAGTSTFNFYVNGALSATSNPAGFGPLDFVNAGPMVFGTVQFQTTPALNDGGTKQSWASYLTGLLDEVRIYDVALSASEVNSLVKLEGRGK